MSAERDFIVHGVLAPVARWIGAGAPASVDGIRLMARRAHADRQIGSLAMSCILDRTAAVLACLVVEGMHGVDSKWIEPDGTVHDASGKGMGHVPWVEKNLEYLTTNVGIDPAKPPMQVANDLVLQKGWVRFMGAAIILPANPTKEQLSALDKIIPKSPWAGGVGRDAGLMVSSPEAGTVTLSIGDVLDKGIERAMAEPGERTAALRTADTGGGSDGPFGQSDGFEKQPDFVSSINGGSPGWPEKSLSYAPQDFAPEVGWHRQLLDYLRRNFPGKKDVAPPETDVATSQEPPKAYASAEDRFMTTASEVVKRFRARQADEAAAPTPSPAAPSPAAPAFPAPPDTQWNPHAAPTGGSAEGGEDGEDLDSPKDSEQKGSGEADLNGLVPELKTFTAWDVASRARLLREASEAEASMSAPDSMTRVAVVLYLKGVKWTEKYTGSTPKRENFFRYEGKDKEGSEYIAHLIGDQPSERGLYQAAIMRRGEDRHSRHAWPDSEAMLEFVKQYWGLKAKAKFRRLRADEFLPRLWASYVATPRADLLQFILDADVEGAQEFVREQFESQRTPPNVRMAMLEAFMDNPKLKGIPAETLRAAALPILVESVTKDADYKAVSRLLNLPNARKEVMKLLENPSVSGESKKAIVQGIISEPEAQSAPKRKDIKEYIRTFMPGEFERTEVPALFEETVELKTKDPGLLKNMERLIAAWEDESNKATAALKQQLESGKAKKANIVDWMKAVQGYNPKLEAWAPNTGMDDMQAFIDLMKNNLATVKRYAPTKLRPFPFKVVVEYQGRGAFYVHLKTSDIPSEIPAEVVKQLSSVHHKNTIAWARVYSFALSAKDGPTVKVWAIDEMQSDIAQRLSQLGFSHDELTKGYDILTAEIPAKKKSTGESVTLPAGTKVVPYGGSGDNFEVAIVKSPDERYLVNFQRLDENSKNGRTPDRYAPNLPVEWGAYRSRLENWLIDWDKILLSLVLRRAKEHGVNQVWLETAESLATSHWPGMMSKKDESGESTTKKMFEQIYDGAARRWGAQKADVEVKNLPEDLRQFKFWAIDVTAIPAERLARRSGPARTAVNPHFGVKESLKVFFDKLQEANVKMTGGRVPPQEAFDLWHMLTCPEDKRDDVEFLEEAVEAAHELGYDVQLPSSLQARLRRETQEGMERTVGDIASMPELTEDSLIEMGRRMEQMPEGPAKERERAKIDRLRRELGAASRGGIVVVAEDEG